MSFELHTANCLDVLATMPDNSVDSIVTDPPYGLALMGKKWDYDVPSEEIWRECLRVLKPGGHLLAFAGTRTQHRMAVRIEDAGFEIRDMIAWVYGSGFPKSLDVSKAIDKVAPRLGQFDAFAAHFSEKLRSSGKTQKEVAALFPSKTGGITGCVWNWANGANVPTVAQWRILRPLLDLSSEWEPLIKRIEAEREVVGKGKGVTRPGFSGDIYGSGGGTPLELNITAPATPAARQWQGWGTALKPALEPITVARKPLVGTVAENVLAHGTGAINVDGCRVEYINDNDKEKANFHGRSAEAAANSNFGQLRTGFAESEDFNHRSGRFPANLIHDGSDEVVGLFPEQAGANPNCVTTKYEKNSEHLKKLGASTPFFHEKTKGSAARFFYCAKASKADRGDGNHHPTVKPTDLMRYLCRLVTPPDGIVLDPFMGSGSTGKAAILEGFQFIGIDMTPEYVDIARARIEHAVKSKPNKLDLE
jgi:DNA modification methylase